MLQPPTPCCRSSFASASSQTLPRDASLCLMQLWGNKIKDRVGRRDKTRQTGANTVKSFQAGPCRRSVTNATVAHLRQSSNHSDGQHKSFHSSHQLLNLEEHVAIFVIFCDVFWNWKTIREMREVVLVGLSTLLEWTDTVGLWSLHASDLFCFTSLSNLIARWSMLPLVLPTRWSERDETFQRRGRQRSSDGSREMAVTVLKHWTDVVLVLLYLEYYQEYRMIQEAQKSASAICLQKLWVRAHHIILIQMYTVQWKAGKMKHCLLFFMPHYINSWPQRTIWNMGKARQGCISDRAPNTAPEVCMHLCLIIRGGLEVIRAL